MNSMRQLLPIVASFAVWFCAPAAQGAVFLWEASSGFTPDAVSTPMTAFDSAAANPVLASGKLTLSTSTFVEDMWYLHQGSYMGISALPEIITQMRYVSGSFAGARSPAMIAFGVGSGVGATIIFRSDLVGSTNQDGSSITASNNTVDTDGAFHEYRISLTGTNNNDPFTVYQDNVAIFSDVLRTSVSAYGTAPVVAFGDFTSIANGVSEWQTFSHNMLVPEPGRMTLLFVALAVVGLRRKR